MIQLSSCLDVLKIKRDQKLRNSRRSSGTIVTKLASKKKNTHCVKKSYLIKKIQWHIGTEQKNVNWLMHEFFVHGKEYSQPKCVHFFLLHQRSYYLYFTKRILETKIEKTKSTEITKKCSLPIIEKNRAAALHCAYQTYTVYRFSRWILSVM